MVDLGTRDTAERWPETNHVGLAKLAAERNVVANVAIRVNPDIDALTHEKIATGKAEKC